MIDVIERKGDGIDILLMKNKNLEVVVSNYGCTVIKIIMNDKHGNKGDIVLGYDDFEMYKTKDAYLGALVGRVANRIKKGTFLLNNQEYNLAVNNGPNHLHGGIQGFSYKVFDYEIKDEKTLVFRYVSKDGEEGYPGELSLEVTYTLEKDTLNMNYYATTTKDTLINITNHSYFNLSSKAESIYNHQLQIAANEFVAIDQDGLATGQKILTQGTAFDFSIPRYLKNCIDLNDEQLMLGKGYDHHFLFNQKDKQVILYHSKTGRKLTVSTTLPGAQIYTANYLEGRTGKYGDTYNERDAICIETQNMPDAIHLEKEPTTILRKGEVYDETTSYTFEVIK